MISTELTLIEIVAILRFCKREVMSGGSRYPRLMFDQWTVRCEQWEDVYDIGVVEVARFPSRDQCTIVTNKTVWDRVIPHVVSKRKLARLLQVPIQITGS